MNQEEYEQFGIPPDNVKAAKKWADKQRKKYRYHTDVPTRKQVRSLPPADLTQMLIGWMVHSPVEIIPSRVQIALVVEVLLQRDDKSLLTDLLAMCRHYIEGN